MLTQPNRLPGNLWPDCPSNASLSRNCEGVSHHVTQIRCFLFRRRRHRCRSHGGLRPVRRSGPQCRPCAECACEPGNCAARRCLAPAARYRHAGRAERPRRCEHQGQGHRHGGQRASGGAQELPVRRILSPLRGARPACAAPALAGRRLGIHRQRRRHRPHQRACDRRGQQGDREADRRARVRSQGRGGGQENRCGRAAHRCERPAHREDRQSHYHARRRMGGGNRFPVRLREQRHCGNHQRQVALAAGRELRALHPDRCCGQPRQFGRAALQPRGRGDRHQFADLFAYGRLPGPVIRDPDRRGDESRGAVGRKRASEPRQAWRVHPGSRSRHRRIVRPAEGRGCARRRPREGRAGSARGRAAGRRGAQVQWPRHQSLERPADGGGRGGTGFDRRDRSLEKGAHRAPQREAHRAD